MGRPSGRAGLQPGSGLSTFEAWRTLQRAGVGFSPHLPSLFGPQRSSQRPPEPCPRKSMEPRVSFPDGSCPSIHLAPIRFRVRRPHHVSGRDRAAKRRQWRLVDIGCAVQRPLQRPVSVRIRPVFQCAAQSAEVRHQRLRGNFIWSMRARASLLGSTPMNVTAIGGPLSPPSGFFPFLPMRRGER